MHINEDYIEDIELQQEEVSASEESAVYPYVLRLRTSVIPNGRGLNFYYDNIIKMNRVIDRALSTFPLIEAYDPDYKIERLSDGKMGWGDEEITLADGHRFFDDPNRINKHSRSMEYEIRIDVSLQTLSQVRNFMIFIWDVLLKAINVSFKAQTSATEVRLVSLPKFISITSRTAVLWLNRSKASRPVFKDAVMFLDPYMKLDDAERIVNDFLDNAENKSTDTQMSNVNLVKKTTMEMLSKCGLKSVIRNIHTEGDDVIVETDSKLKIRGYQIQHLNGKKVFRDVEELIISDANEGQIDKADELAQHGWFPNLKRVTVCIDTSKFMMYNEVMTALAKPGKPIEIDLTGYFSDYKLDVKVKTNDYILYGSNINVDRQTLRLVIKTDNGTKQYTFDVYNSKNY